MAVTAPEEIARARGLLEGWARGHLGTHYLAFETGLGQVSQAISDNWASVAGTLATSLWSQGLALFNFLSLMLITPLVVFYVLMDWHRMLAKIDSWLPRDHAATLRQLATDINDAVSAFIRGQGTVCFVLAIYYSVALTAAGLRYGLLVGLGTGLMSFVPFVGWALGLITATTIATVQFWPEVTPILIVVGIFAGAQVLDAGFLSPNIVGAQDRAAPGLAHLLAVRVQLPVRLRGRARRGADRRGDRRDRSLRAESVSPERCLPRDARPFRRRLRPSP